jgi:hypothetical protein
MDRAPTWVAPPRAAAKASTMPVPDDVHRGPLCGSVSPSLPRRTSPAGLNAGGHVSRLVCVQALPVQPWAARTLLLDIDSQGSATSGEHAMHLQTDRGHRGLVTALAPLGVDQRPYPDASSGSHREHVWD